MKVLSPAFALLLFAAAPLAAQGIAQVPLLQSLKVLDTPLPVYPHDLVQLGVREGEVRIAFSIDATGKIEDCLVVAYSHPEFARVTLNSLRKWKFEPARYRGQPIAAASEVSVKFQVEGTVVVSLTPGETLSARLFSLIDNHDSYRPRTLRELDRIPTPITAPSPGVPPRFSTPGTVGHVTVAFYIDEEGAVRLPSVSEDDDPELASVCIEALRHWKFEPPTCKGRPVLVRASQLFNFHSVQPKPATASN